MPALARMLDIDFHEITDKGPVREQNEDSIGHWEHDGGLMFAVADGLGGHAAGEVASSVTLEVLAKSMTEAPASWPVTKRLRRAVQDANLELHSKSLVVPELHGMATTLTASVVQGGMLVTAHVGDSRLLLLRGDELRQLTKDHTWVAEQVSYGRLTAEAARTHPRRHHLTRSLGSELIVGIDVLSFTLEPGDVLIQCSDGIHGVLDEAAFRAGVATGSAEQACGHLLGAAIEAGSEDNLSVQVLAVRNCPAPAPARPWWRFGR